MSEVREIPRQWEHSEGQYIEKENGFLLRFVNLDPKGVTTIVLMVGGLMLSFGVWWEVYIDSYKFSVWGTMFAICTGVFGFTLIFLMLPLKIAKNKVLVDDQTIRIQKWMPFRYFPRRMEFGVDDVEFVININTKRIEKFVMLHRTDGWVHKMAYSELVALTSDGNRICFEQWPMEELRWVTEMINWKHPYINVYEYVDGHLAEREDEGVVVSEVMSDE
ncbi:hypothetical protein JD969_08940 [Planctomycetota bacterium]|nr:hypothetical protein JD969_08940 [Planctomycetota bacterium]